MTNKLYKLTSASIELSKLVKNPEVKEYQKEAYQTALDLVNREINFEIIDNY